MNKYLKSALIFLITFFAALLISAFGSSAFHTDNVTLEAIRVLIFSVNILAGVVALCTCLIISSINKK